MSLGLQNDLIQGVADFGKVCLGDGIAFVKFDQTSYADDARFK